VKVRELVETTGISHGTVISILHEQLGMKKAIGKMDAAFAHCGESIRAISKQCLEMFFVT